MQVFGLPGHVIRNGRGALAAGPGGRADRRKGRPGGRRRPLHALPLGEGRRAEKPQAASSAQAPMVARTGPRGRGRPRR
jgi:hypothetical protein